MEHPGFFERAGPVPVGELAQKLEADLQPGADAGRLVHDVRSLSDAGPNEMSFIDNRKYVEALGGTLRVEVEYGDERIQIA